jgi:hypothetical protein
VKRVSETCLFQKAQSELCFYHRDSYLKNPSSQSLDEKRSEGIFVIKFVPHIIFLNCFRVSDTHTSKFIFDETARP